METGLINQSEFSLSHTLFHHIYLYIHLKYKYMQYAASMNRRRRNSSLFSLRRTMCVCVCVCVIRRKETGWCYSQGLENFVWQYVCVCKNISFYCVYSRKIVVTQYNPADIKLSLNHCFNHVTFFLHTYTYFVS